MTEVRIFTSHSERLNSYILLVARDGFGHDYSGPKLPFRNTLHK